MTEQDLDRSQVARRLVNRSFGSPRRVSPMLRRIESDCFNPFIDEPCILPRVQVSRVIDPTWKVITVDWAAAPFQPDNQASPGIRSNFELDRPSGFFCVIAARFLISGPETKSPILSRTRSQPLSLLSIARSNRALSLFAIEQESDRPDLLLGERSLRAYRAGTGTSASRPKFPDYGRKLHSVCPANRDGF